MISQVAQALKKAESLVIASHTNPEADAIGSTVALGMALERLGVKVYVYNETGLPRNLAEFAGAEKVKSELPKWTPDMLAVLDCGDYSRIGKISGQAFAKVKTIVNVDHHATNDGFGHINWVEGDTSSTGEMVARLIDELDSGWTPEMAEWVFAAVVSDTGSFQFANSKPSTFMTAAKLVERGARPQVVSRRLFGNLPEANLRLLAMALATLEVDSELKLATMRVGEEMFRATGTGSDAVEGFIEHPRSLIGVNVAALLRQIGADKYKVSLRSKGEVNVAEIAASFGGGGHREAAGFAVDGDYEKAKSVIKGAIAARVK